MSPNSIPLVSTQNPRRRGGGGWGICQEEEACCNAKRQVIVQLLCSELEGAGARSEREIENVAIVDVMRQRRTRTGESVKRFSIEEGRGIYSFASC